MKQQRITATQKKEEKAREETIDLITTEDVVETAVYAMIVPDENRREEEMLSLLGAEVVNPDIGNGEPKMV